MNYLVTRCTNINTAVCVYLLFNVAVLVGAVSLTQLIAMTVDFFLSNTSAPYRTRAQPMALLAFF